MATIDGVLQRLGIQEEQSGCCHDVWIARPGGDEVASINPATGRPIARVRTGSADDYGRVAARAVETFHAWRTVPAPRRGEVIRQFGELLRAHKADLGLLVTLETGKILSEGEGEVQEMIDMCDFAVGLSRQLHGLTIASERPAHRMLEQWHPLGPVGIITAFNFPMAVWSWNAAVAAVCGDTMIWKPSPQAPLSAVAVQNLANRVAWANKVRGLFTLCAGAGETVGEAMLADPRLPLVSATGSCRMGRRVAEVVGK